MRVDAALLIDLLEERAAIREYDGGQTRAEAEEGALADVARSTGLGNNAVLAMVRDAQRKAQDKAR